MSQTMKVDISAAKAEARKRAGMRLVGEESSEDLEAFRLVKYRLTVACESHALRNGGQLAFNEEECMALYRAIKGS